MQSRLALVTPELVERAQQRDKAAVQRLLQNLSGPIFNLALRMLLLRADAEDATQEALLRVVNGLDSYRGESKFSTWAWTVATRSILDHRRARAPKLTFETFAEDLSVGLDHEAEERTDDALRAQQVKLGCGRALLQCLDADHRAAYILGEILGFPGEDVATILGLSHAAFRKRVSRARDRIRAALSESCGIVNEQAACLCHRRIGRAEELGRLSPEDALVAIDVRALRRTVQGLDELERDVALYQADPDAVPAAAFLPRVMELIAK